MDSFHQIVYWIIYFWHVRLFQISNHIHISLQIVFCDPKIFKIVVLDLLNFLNLIWQIAKSNHPSRHDFLLYYISLLFEIPFNDSLINLVYLLLLIRIIPQLARHFNLLHPILIFELIRIIKRHIWIIDRINLQQIIMHQIRILSINLTHLFTLIPSILLFIFNKLICLLF